MNISEKFNEKMRLEQQVKETKTHQRLNEFFNKITTTLGDSETIESIENYLVENGAVSITDFGCLCQKSFCDWQEGLNVMLIPLIEEWELKGVKVYASLNLEFRVESNRPSGYTIKKTIKELKEWNKSKNR